MKLALAGVLALLGIALLAFSAPLEPLAMKVDFGQKVRDWDGFGVNYVETHQTRDYRKLQDEYGGFSLLSPDKREKILDMIFGADGLRPSLIKMFLDPFHEGYTAADNDNQDPNVINMARFDHQTTTAWMRFFAKQGLARTRKRGGGLTIITTLYGPMPWGTKQKFVRGRDLDRMIVFGEGSLWKAIHEFVVHCHGERNHHGLGNQRIIPDENHAGNSGTIRSRNDWILPFHSGNFDARHHLAKSKGT